MNCHCETNAPTAKVKCRICANSSHLDCLNGRLQCGPKSAEGEFVCRRCRVHLAHPNLVLERNIKDAVLNVSNGEKKKIKFGLKHELEENLNSVLLFVSTNCIDFEAECVTSAMLPSIRVSVNGTALKMLDEVTALEAHTLTYQQPNTVTFEIDSDCLLQIASKDKIVEKFINDKKSCLIFSLLTASEIVFDYAVGYAIMNCTENGKDAGFELNWNEHFSWFCERKVKVPAICRCGSLEEGICLRAIVLEIVTHQGSVNGVSTFATCKKCNRKLSLANICVNKNAVIEYFAYFEANVINVNKAAQSQENAQKKQNVSPEELFPSFRSKQPENMSNTQQKHSVLIPIRKKTEALEKEHSDRNLGVRREFQRPNSVREAQPAHKRVKEQNSRSSITNRSGEPSQERGKLTFSNFVNLSNISFIKNEIREDMTSKDPNFKLPKYNQRWLGLLRLTNAEASKKDVCEWMQLGWFAAEELTAYEFDESKVSAFCSFVASVLNNNSSVETVNFVLKRVILGMLSFISGQKSLLKDHIRDTLHLKMTCVVVAKLRVLYRFLYDSFYYFKKHFDRNVAYESMKRALHTQGIRDSKLISKIASFDSF